MLQRSASRHGTRAVLFRHSRPGKSRGVRCLHEFPGACRGVLGTESAEAPPPPGFGLQSQACFIYAGFSRKHVHTMMLESGDDRFLKWKGKPQSLTLSEFAVYCARSEFQFEVSDSRQLSFLLVSGFCYSRRFLGHWQSRATTFTMFVLFAQLRMARKFSSRSWSWAKTLPTKCFWYCTWYSGVDAVGWLRVHRVRGHRGCNCD